MPMQPSPKAETIGPPRPSLRCFMTIKIVGRFCETPITASDTDARQLLLERAPVVLFRFARSRWAARILPSGGGSPEIARHSRARPPIVLRFPASVAAWLYRQ